MNQLACLLILYTIRNSDENRVPLIDLYKIYNPQFTGYQYLDFSPLIDLCIEGYIEIIDEHYNNITKSIYQMDQYELIQIIHNSSQNPIYAKLTRKLFKMQSLLGFSISDTIFKLSHNGSMMVNPIFNESDLKLESDVFVIMPFEEKFNFLYKKHIKKVCKKNKLSCKRADDIYSSKPIIQDIWSLIVNSKIIIADCSNKNPNVMYELGIAHAIGKKVILITQDINDIPFDLRHLRHLHYQYAPHSIDILDHELELAINSYL